VGRDEARIALFREMQEAVARAEAAKEAFSAMTSKIPSGPPHPEGVQRIQNVSHELTEARNEMMKAHNRLNEFLERGIVPEDLKRSG
jgi:predicted urease superfamily metal-dependent hydrolase